MKEIFIIIAIVLLLIFCCWVDSAIHDEYTQKAKNYCKQNNMTLLSCEPIFWDYGPFYFKSKNQHIYRCEVDDHGKVRKLYIRQGMMFSDDEYEFYDK